MRRLYSAPHEEVCLFKRRLGRFVVELDCGGVNRLAHLANTGRLEQFLRPGNAVYCRRGRKPGALRVVAASWGGVVALLDTREQERAFGAAVGMGLIPWLRGCRAVKVGARVDGAVIDFELSCPNSTFVELKSAVALLRGGYAGYPDAPTKRGRAHIRLLASLASRGLRAIVAFAVGFPGSKGVKVMCERDPAFLEALRVAAESGAELRALELVYDPADGGVYLGSAELPVLLECGELEGLWARP